MNSKVFIRPLNLSDTRKQRILIISILRLAVIGIYYYFDVGPKTHLSTPTKIKEPSTSQVEKNQLKRNQTEQNEIGPNKTKENKRKQNRSKYNRSTT
jgi:hypothetical protein